MSFVGLVPFIGFVVAEVILRQDMKASVKRKAFRWCLILSALALLVVMPLEGVEVELLIFVAPVLAGVCYLVIQCTKVCEWCSTAVRTNEPFVDKEHCPRCGSSLK